MLFKIAAKILLDAFLKVGNLLSHSALKFRELGLDDLSIQSGTGGLDRNHAYLQCLDGFLRS